MPKIIYSVEAVNNRLKQKGSKVRLEVRGKGALCIRTTLPPKPLSRRKNPYQQRIPLGLTYIDDGKANTKQVRIAVLKKAEAIAEKLNTDLIYNSFDWKDYGGAGTVQHHSIDELVGQFKKHYLRFNKLQEKTWTNNWQRYFNYLPKDKKLSADLLTKTIAAHSTPNTKTRDFFCSRYTSLAEFAKIDVDFSIFKSNAHETIDRDIPGDSQLIMYRPQVEGSRYRKSRIGWQWLYSILFVAGLRPHEAFFCQWSKDGLEVLKGKTGPRTVLYEVMELMTPGLIDKWDLKNICYPGIDYESAYNDGSLGRKITRQFWKWKVPVKAYDLRHAFALRGIANDVPVPVMANMMGHSELTHVEVYRKWLSTNRSKTILQEMLESKANSDK